jgi:hypothetical protein
MDKQRKPAPEPEVVYWTTFMNGGVEMVCSKHSTVKEAEDAARECERKNKFRHSILKVTVIR